MDVAAYWSTIGVYIGNMEAQWLDIREDGAGWWLWMNVYDFTTYRFYWRVSRRGLLELDITDSRQGTRDERGFRVLRERPANRRVRVGFTVERGYNVIDEPTWVLRLREERVFDHRASDRYTLEGRGAPRPSNPWAFRPGSRVRYARRRHLRQAARRS